LEKGKSLSAPRGFAKQSDGRTLVSGSNQVHDLLMDQPDPQLEDRAKKAERIIADPGKFKICEGCDSIVAARVTVCPNCFGYRFDPDPQAVIAQAGVLAKRARTSVIADDLT
jgi:hypothetical protein